MLALFTKEFFTRKYASQDWPGWAHYLGTVTVVAAIVALMPPVYAQEYPLQFFYGAVMLCALVFNHGSGYLAVIVSGLISTWFFLEPAGSFQIESGVDLIALLWFTVIGFLIATLIETLEMAVYKLKQLNEQCTADERAKDLLLREASHRMRNDLHMIAGLVEIQERGIKNDAAREILLSTAHRIRLIASIQEKLKRTEKGVVVDMKNFIKDLCDNLRESFLCGRPLELNVEAESHNLLQEKAVAVGLILHETLTNALKYAFPDDRNGKIGVRFARENDQFVAIVSDNGIGLQEGGAPEGSGMGHRLVQAMASQLRGDIIIRSEPHTAGTTAVLKFPVSD